jgi:hypothetical protein
VVIGVICLPAPPLDDAASATIPSARSIDRVLPIIARRLGRQPALAVGEDCPILGILANTALHSIEGIVHLAKALRITKR